MEKYRLFSENQWMFPDDEVTAFDPELTKLDLPRGGNVMVQMLTDVTVAKGEAVSLCVDNANGILVQVYQMVPVHIPRNSAPDGISNTTDNPEEVKDFVTRMAPFDVYDAMAPVDGGCRYAGRLALGIRLTACREMLPCTQEMKVVITVAGSCFEVPLCATVHKAIIPTMQESKLTVVNWVYPSWTQEFCGDDYYSDAYWKKFREIMSHLVDIRNTHFSLAITREYKPDIVIRDESGKIVDFDISNIEKALKIADEFGFQKLYGPYIARWKHWEDAELYLLWGSEDNTEVTTLEAYRQMKIFFARIREMVERNGWQDKYIQPLLDEPQFYNAAAYRILTGVVRGIYPELVIHDPVEIYNIPGAVDIACVKQAIYEKYLAEFQALQAEGQRLTYYSCGYPAGRMMNRVLDLPVTVGRLSFWMCHKYNFEGFLHWGYHVEGNIRNNNFMDKMAPGNQCIVYHVDGEYWESLRSNNQRAGAEDWELLAIIGAKDPELMQKLITRGCRTFEDYEMDWQVVESIRKDILLEADRCMN